MAQRKRITTPKGTALYPHLRTPETYDGEVVGFTVQLQLSAAETKEMVKFLEGELDAAKNSSEFKGKKWTNARLGTKVDKNGDTVLKFKKLSVSFFRTTHSIPDTLGIAVHTPLGAVVFTGDFKFDLTPVMDQPAPDFQQALSVRSLKWLETQHPTMHESRRLINWFG